MSDTQPEVGGVLLTGAEYERYRQQDAKMAALVAALRRIELDAETGADESADLESINAFERIRQDAALAATGKEEVKA